MFSGTPPTRTNPTRWRHNTSSVASGLIGDSSGKPSRVPQATHSDREICGPPDPFTWRQRQHLMDVREIRVVGIGEPDGQLQPTRPDDPLQRFEARLRLAALPAPDLRLRLPEPLSELHLCEA